MLAKTPWSPVPKAQPKKLDKQARKRFVLIVLPILMRAQPTFFRFEGMLRHGIRTHLLLRGGFTWIGADGEAAYVVARALQRVGAKRPTDERLMIETRGDKGYSPARCRNPECEKTIERESRNGQRPLYCSDLCRMRANNRRAYWANRAKGEPRKCEACGASSRRRTSPVARRKGSAGRRANLITRARERPMCGSGPRGRQGSGTARRRSDGGTA